MRGIFFDDKTFVLREKGREEKPIFGSFLMRSPLHIPPTMFLEYRNFMNQFSRLCKRNDCSIQIFRQMLLRFSQHISLHIRRTLTSVIR